MIRKVNMMYEACMGDAIKSPADFAVYAALCFYAGEERFCSPSVRELARMLHAGHATVARGLKALEQAGLVPEIAEVTMRAENTIDLGGDDAARMQKLLDVLEDLDDVQEVYHNAAL